MRKISIVAAGVCGIVLMFFATFAMADDYRWIKIPDSEGEQLIPIDPKICKLYEENLKYFAKQNTPMSCNRPIAPHLKDRIKEVEWEDLDPDRYPELFRAVVTLHKYLPGTGEDIIQRDLKFIREDIAKKIRVFRRAKLSLVGRICVYEPTATPEQYWIVQYGVNDVSPSNPKESYRCKPTRGGIDWDPSNLDLYVVSENKLELIGWFGTTLRPSSEGQFIRLIDGRLFVENINKKALIELNEVKVESAFTDTVCIFKFKKSSNRGK